jgi:hypothetical protein
VLLAGEGGTTNEQIHEIVCDTHRQGGSGSGSGSGKSTWNPTTPTNNEKSMNSERGESDRRKQQTNKQCGEVGGGNMGVGVDFIVCNQKIG